MDILQTFAEISITVAGFAAVVVAFRNRNHEKWNLYQFQGMIGHAAFAFVFSCLPFLLTPFFSEEIMLLTCSALIGVFTLFQGIIATIVDKKSGILIKAELVAGTLFVSYMQYINIMEYYFQLNIGPYLIGIFWHIFQSIIIFTFFMMNPE